VASNWNNEAINLNCSGQSFKKDFRISSLRLEAHSEIRSPKPPHSEIQNPTTGSSSVDKYILHFKAKLTA